MKPSASRHSKNKELISIHKKEYLDQTYRVLSCDTEDDSKGKTYIINFFDGDHHYTFDHTETAVEFLIEYSKQYKKGVIVWFANQAYDIGNLFRQTQEYLSFNVVGSRFITGKIFQEKVKFRDIFNVIPGSSVKSLGKMINLEKIETDDFNNTYYCQRDTEIVYWALVKFKKALDRLNIDLKNTAAATGFSALLQLYPALSYNSFSEDDQEFLKQGYYGGRTEVFNTAKQKGEIYGYDIVSSYPNVMTKIPLMVSHCRYYTKRPKLEIYEGVIDCVVECPNTINIPYLPVRIDDKLCFPSGKFQGTWTYFEVREALKLGYKLIKINKALEFKLKHNFSLKEFVDKIFTERKKAQESKDDVLQYACKIILNASYGKFALGNEKTELIPFNELWKIKGDFKSEVFPNNQVIVKRKTTYNPSTNYLTASYITAYARHDLYNYIMLCSSEERIPLYCDTDSIFFKGKKLNISQDKKLGALMLEHTIKECQFILPKTYYIVWNDGSKKYKCKGVREKLAEEFFTKGYAESMQPLKYIETCRKNFFIKERNKKFKTKEKYIPFNLWVKKPKSMRSKYDKRIINKSGATKPIELNFDLESNEYI